MLDYLDTVPWESLAICLDAILCTDYANEQELHSNAYQNRSDKFQLCKQWITPIEPWTLKTNVNRNWERQWKQFGDDLSCLCLMERQSGSKYGPIILKTSGLLLFSCSNGCFLSCFYAFSQCVGQHQLLLRSFHACKIIWFHNDYIFTLQLAEFLHLHLSLTIVSN